MVTERVDDKVGAEIFRLLKISRETEGAKILDEALAGRERNVNTISRLYRFVRDSFGPAVSPFRPELDSEVTKKFQKACRDYLQDAGVDEKEIHKILSEPKTRRCVLEEFET